MAVGRGCWSSSGGVPVFFLAAGMLRKKRGTGTRLGCGGGGKFVKCGGGFEVMVGNWEGWRALAIQNKVLICISVLKIFLNVFEDFSKLFFKESKIV